MDGKTVLCAGCLTEIEGDIYYLYGDPYDWSCYEEETDVYLFDDEE